MVARRVEWPPGDPKREREAWAKDALRYAGVKRKPAAGRLVTVVARYLNATDGYAFPSNETLAADLGAHNISAVAYALDVAEALGLIERETSTILGDGGRVVGSRRRIFATRPQDMADVLTFGSRRRAKPTSESHRLPNSETIGNSPVNSVISPTFGSRCEGDTSTDFRISDHRLPNGSDAILDSQGIREKKYSSTSVVEGTRVSDLGEAAHRLAGRSSILVDIVEALSRFPAFDGSATDEEAGHLVEIGRRIWSQRRAGRLSDADATIAFAHLRDAAIRSWIDHTAPIRKMLGVFEAGSTA